MGCREVAFILGLSGPSGRFQGLLASFRWRMAEIAQMNYGVSEDDVADSKIQNWISLSLRLQHEDECTLEFLIYGSAINASTL